MEKAEILKYLEGLDDKELQSLLLSIKKNKSVETDFLHRRRDLLNNKQGACPYCNSNKYVRNGKENNVQRYVCKSCRKSFTEFTGTWLAGLHLKELVIPYLKLMEEERSLDYIKASLTINKKTALDWRHKILSSLNHSEKEDFTGITESDETTFLFSEKGRKVKSRKSRKRGRKGSFPEEGSKQGLKNNEFVSVIVTTDRNKQLDLTLASKGKLKKENVEIAIKERVNSQTILCTDGSTAFKAFCKDINIEHHVIKTSQKQFSNGVYHIQHVNSLHNKLKKWIDKQFWGVSTKYLQKYLNWFRIKDMIKNGNQTFDFLINASLLDTNTKKRFFDIENQYQLLKST